MWMFLFSICEMRILRGSWLYLPRLDDTQELEKSCGGGRGPPRLDIREYAQGVFFWFLDIFSAYSRCHMSKKWGVGRKYDFVGFKKGLRLAVRLFWKQVKFGNIWIFLWGLVVRGVIFWDSKWGHCARRCPKPKICFAEKCVAHTLY